MKRCGVLCLLILSGTVMAGKDKGTPLKEQEQERVDYEAFWEAHGSYVRSEKQKERLRKRERQEQEIEALRLALLLPRVNSQ